MIQKSSTLNQSSFVSLVLMPDKSSHPLRND